MIQKMINHSMQVMKLSAEGEHWPLILPVVNLPWKMWLPNWFLTFFFLIFALHYNTRSLAWQVPHLATGTQEERLMVACLSRRPSVGAGKSTFGTGVGSQWALSGACHHHNIFQISRRSCWGAETKSALLEKSADHALCPLYRLLGFHLLVNLSMVFKIYFSRERVFLQHQFLLSVSVLITVQFEDN